MGVGGSGSGRQPLVSVVIATHDMAAYLPLAVRSVLEQTYRRLEVLVVDDGSTDGTADAMGPLLADPRLRYLPQPNRGQAVAKNRGIEAASGELVAFLDADDFWRHDKLALQVPLFDGPQAPGVVYSRVRYIDRHGHDQGVADNRLFRGQVSGELLIRNFIGFGTSVVRRECFERLGGFDETLGMGIDYDLWLRLSARYAFDYVDEPLLLYRRWDGQMSRNVTRRYENGIRTMERFLREHPGLVARRTVDEAWAHTFVGYGCSHLDLGGRRLARTMFLRALRHRVTYVPAWRALLYSLRPPPRREPR